MKVRRFRQSDFDQVWLLHQRVFEQHGNDLGNAVWEQDLKDISKAYLDSGGEFLVGFDNDNLVAMGALRKLDSENIEIKRMRVDPDCQRMGYGKAILEALEQSAFSMGYKRVVLDTTIQLHGSQKFYLKNGYQEVERKKLGDLDLVFFEKRLCK